MKIQFNTVTWYSKLTAMVVFLLVVPVVAFYLGTQYELTVVETAHETIEIPAVIEMKEDESSCDNLNTQGDMNACAWNQFQKAQKRLDALFASISQTKRFNASNLNTLQKQWVSYRDAECKARALEFEGGSMEPLVISRCNAELTNDRIKALQFWLYKFEL